MLLNANQKAVNCHAIVTKKTIILDKLAGEKQMFRAIILCNFKICNNLNFDGLIEYVRFSKDKPAARILFVFIYEPNKKKPQDFPSKPNF